MNVSLPIDLKASTQARQPKFRATFALDQVEALPRLAERIDRLSETSLESNPFFLPEFLEPAIHAFGAKNLRLATCSDRDELLFFAPVLCGRSPLGPSRLAVWTHPYAPLGSPLIDRDLAPQIADALLAFLRSSGRRSLALPHLPLAGPTARALRQAARRGGSVIEAGRRGRPVLRTEPRPAPDTFERMISAKHRRELDRQLRRLCETGAVSHLTARSGTEMEAAFAMFLALENSGWKGRRGTALDQSEAVLDFAGEAIERMAQRGAAAIDVIRVGERPVAALIRFDHAGLSIPWKIAYDESFSAFSPGKQLICDATRRWLRDPTVLRVDPICEESNPLMTGILKESEPYGTITVTARRRDLGAQLGSALVDLREAGKQRAKAFLKRHLRGGSAGPTGRPKGDAHSP